MPQGQVYRPSVVISLRIRFDDSYNVIEGPEPVSPTELIASPATIPEGTSLVPLVLDGQGDELSQVLNIVPIDGSIDVPTYREPGKFAFNLDYRDVPFDPRVLEAMAVEIHIGTVADNEFGPGITNPVPGQKRRSILVTHDESGTPNPETFIMTGIVRSISVDMSESGHYVFISGNDLTEILCNSHIDVSMIESLDLGQDIENVVNQIISLHPMGKKTKAKADRTEWPEGVLPVVLEIKGVTRVKKGSSGKKGRSTPKQSGDKLTYWGTITWYCMLVGAVAYFRGDQLRIRPLRNVFDVRDKSGDDPSLNPTPFAGGKIRVIDGREVRIREMVYGRDIMNWNFSRKLGGVQVPVVKVVSMDTSSKVRGEGKLVQSSWPPATDNSAAAVRARRTTSSASGKAAEEKGLTIPMAGINDPARLSLIAQSFHDEIGRNEMTGNCSGSNLSSFGGGNADPDILKIRVGDPVKFNVDASRLSSKSPIVSELQNRARRGFDEEVEFIATRLGNKPGDKQLARVLVASSRNAILELLDVFKISGCSYKWDSEKGIDYSFTFKNYATRFQIGPPPPVPAGTVVGAAKPKKKTGTRLADSLVNRSKNFVIPDE